MFKPGRVAFGDDFFCEKFGGVGCGFVLELNGLGHESMELDPFGAEVEHGVTVWGLP